MQPTNRPHKQQSRCLYCGSTTRGKGCRYGPHGVHFHPDDPTKCAYCGSPNYGRGCKINPTADIHVHGVNYNSMFKEQIQSFLDNEILIRELKKDFVDYSAFKLKLIDEKGNKLKNPVTEEEQIAFTPFIKTIIKLKKYLGSKVDLIEATTSLEKNNLVTEDIEKYKIYLEFKDRIEKNINELYQIIDEAACNGLRLEDIKKLINA
jgi:hypothetical protein